MNELSAERLSLIRDVGERLLSVTTQEEWLRELTAGIQTLIPDAVLRLSLEEPGEGDVKGSAPIFLLQHLFPPEIYEEGEREGEEVSSPFAISVPLVCGQEWFGLCHLYRPGGNRVVIEASDLSVAITIIRQAAASLKAIRLRSQVQMQAQYRMQQFHRQILVNRVALALNTSLDAYEILNIAIRHLVELTEADYGSALIPEKDQPYARLVIELPRLLGYPRVPFRLWPSLQRTLAQGIPYVVRHAKYHPIIKMFQGANLNVQSLLLLPIANRREIIGLLLFASRKQAEHFSEEVVKACQTVASQAAAAISNARLLQNIQQQRRALARKSQEMTEESGKLDAIINNISDGLVVTDRDGNVILCNPAFRAIARLSPREPWYRRPLAELFPLPNPQALIAQALERPTQTFSNRHVSPNSNVVWQVSTNALRIPPSLLEPEAKEQIIGVVIVLRDITHTARLEHLKNNLIMMVSHTLRTPLTAILGFSKLVQRDLQRYVTPHLDPDTTAHEAAERILENLKTIEDTGQYLDGLIDDMLEITHIEGGQALSTWSMGPVELPDIIREAVRLTEPLVQEKGLSIEIILPDAEEDQGLPPMWGSRKQMVKAVARLLSSAVQFATQGPIEVSVTRYEPGEGDGHPTNIPSSLLVRIAFAGTEPRAEELPYLFDKFTPLGAPNSTSGESDLGLVLSKEIIVAHRGRIWAGRENEQNCVLCFTIPQAIVSPVEEVRSETDGSRRE